MFAPEQHDLYDGHYILSANRIYMVGGLNDAPGWDHLDNNAVNVKPVAGSVEIDVDEIKNTGKFEARLKIPEGDLLLAMDRLIALIEASNLGSRRVAEKLGFRELGEVVHRGTPLLMHEIVATPR